MGGFGSTRWHGHVKKTTVEECLTLSMGVLADCYGFAERVPWKGQITWSNVRTGEETDSIGFQFKPLEGEHGPPARLRLYYTIRRRQGPFSGDEEETRDIDYWIDLETTPCNFGGERWWFRCPLVRSGVPCKRRCFKLYCPPGGDYYGCRECYDLSYRSAQEAHKFDSLYQRIAADMGTSMKAVKKALTGRWKRP